MRARATCLVVLLLALAAGLLPASYLESDYPEEKRAPRRIIPPPPPPHPVPSNPLTNMIGRLSVREGYRYKGLTVFPIHLSRVTQRAVYLSAEEALAEGVLIVKEKGSGSVPTLTVENRGDKPILMLGGELLLGGKQNRVLREDVLLPARSGPVEAPVLCVEKGRWSGRAGRFESRKSLAPLAVRGSAQAGRSQDEIWAGVSEYQKRFKVESRTGDLQAVQDSPEVRKALADYRSHFAEHCWRPQHVGMVVARYERIVGADIFCNAAMFRKHRDRLLESYAVDCIAHHSYSSRLPSRDDAERFLRRALHADHTWRATPGTGRLLRVSGAALSGSALILKDNVLHACLFPQSVIIVRPVPPVRIPEPIPVPRPLPGPRNPE